MADRLKTWARAIKRDVHAVYLAGRDPRVLWTTKALAIAVAGYALSPIDLIPDFIPVLGYLDDIIIIPLGIMLVLKLIPHDIMAAHRATRRPWIVRSAAPRRLHRFRLGRIHWADGVVCLPLFRRVSVARNGPVRVHPKKMRPRPDTAQRGLRGRGPPDTRSMTGGRARAPASYAGRVTGL